MDLRKGLEDMLELMKCVLLQARMGNSINSEVLYKLDRENAYEIVNDIKKRYLEQKKEG